MRTRRTTINPNPNPNPNPNQVLNEDAHVTHHKYPGTHWSNTPNLLDKHKDDFDQAGSAGADNPDGYGSVFTNTHVFEVGSP